MKKENLILWVASIVVTFLVIYLTNLFDRRYPITGTIGIDGQKVSYRFEKVHYGKENADVLIRSDVEDLSGKLFWKSDMDNAWFSENMHPSNMLLSSKLPSLKANQKLKYYVEILYKDKKYFLPGNQKVEMTYYGNIPSTIRFLRFLLIYLGLLLVVRVGLEYFNRDEKIKKLEIFIAIIFLILTVMINPLYLSYKYGFINTSIPTINKLFPFKELSISALWIITIVLTFNVKKYKLIPLISAVITILIYSMIN